MGDLFNEGERDERPVHKVCVNDFFLGRYEVTQGQWVQIMEDNPSAIEIGEDYPVDWVSWDDTQLFLARMTNLSKRHFRLPTEAEWEYACRGKGKKVRYGTKDGRISKHLANFGNGKWGEVDESDRYMYTAPVGSYPPNELGLYDMSGNVWEWVADWKDMNFSYYEISPENDPKGPDNGIRRVGRGGAWNFGPIHQRCSNRFSNWPYFHCVNYGFRVLLEPIASKK
jgi:formylglycine-generating enzyme